MLEIFALFSLFLFAFVILGITRAPLFIWSLSISIILFFGHLNWNILNYHSPLSLTFFALVVIGNIFLYILCLPKFRKYLFIRPIFNYVKNILPKVSDTEQQALEAGSIGFDAELFSGKPDWNKIRSIPTNILTSEEQNFLNGPTEKLCSLIDDWDIRHNQREIPDKIWNFVIDQGFLGMLISKEYGGLGFSAQAQSVILGKIASRSPDVVTIVMVPNSLGPGELIEKYGTSEQKNYFLPLLASGKEIPCFALTGPESGSDAASMLDIGRVGKGVHEGKEKLGIRITWNKRYITLAPKATLLGLAFRLFDPDNFLGKGDDVGITLALIPAKHPGVHIGRRHLPSGAAFPNGPNWGSDVFIPIEWVIGGQRMVGQGWRMLMECLAAGRAISLPSSATAGTKTMLRVTSAYARVRTQFGIPIGKMEGVEEALARIVEAAYINESARSVTAGMISQGERPSVLSALMKYQTTERLRQAVNHAMDIHGGKAICDGPQNYLRSAFEMVPIGITVEGANILTRTLITFAQGALRSHPYLYKEIKAVQNVDREIGCSQFEVEFINHLSHIISNISWSILHNLTLGLFAPSPEVKQILIPYYKKFQRASCTFSVVSDFVIVSLGGSLKVKQKISGRMADALSELYFGACVLKRYEDDGCPEEDIPILRMSLDNCLARFDTTIQGTISNLSPLPVRYLLKTLIYPFGSHYKKASDSLEGIAARLVLRPGQIRDRLTRDIYLPSDSKDPMGILEQAFEKTVQSEAAEKKLFSAMRAGILKRFHGMDWISEAYSKNIITKNEEQLLREVDKLKAKVIAVDDFDPYNNKM